MAAEAKKKGNQTAKAGKGPEQKEKTTAKKNSKASGTGTKKEASRKGGQKEQNQEPSQKDTEHGKRQRKDFAIADEVLIWISLAFCVLLFISVLGFGGVFGNAVKGFLFGMFGLPAYVFPILLFFQIAFLVSNRGSLPAWIKTASCFLLYFCACAYAELITNAYVSSRRFLDYYADSARYQNGGGLTGGFLVSIGCPALGVVGTWVVLIILTIICVIMITERSLLAGMKKGGQRVVQSAMDDASLRRERADIRREKRNLERRQKLAMEKQYLEEERRKLEKKSKEVQAKIVNDFQLGTDGPQTIPMEEIHEVLPDLSGQKAVPPRPVAVFGARTNQTGEIKVFRPELVTGKEKPFRMEPGQEKIEFQPEPEIAHRSFRPEPINLDPVEPKPLHQEADKEDHAVFSEDFQIHRSEPVPAYESEFGAELLRMGRERGGQPDSLEDIPPSDEILTDESEYGEPDIFEDVKPESQGAASEKASASSGPPKNPRSSKEEQAKQMADVAMEIQETAQEPKPEYVFPPIELLKRPKQGKQGDSDDTLRRTAQKLQQTLHNFGVEVTVSNVSCGPTVTRYELTPEQGVRVSKIVSLSDDIKLNLAAADIRIEAPIPGKMAVGIEVPNKENSTVFLRELLESKEFRQHPSNLAFAAGKDIGGRVVVTDIAKMPHLLIAGSTGSGKSVCINTIIMSILYKAKPEDVKLIMVDPKVVELSVYNGIPHLLIPVVTDPKKAAGALNWAVAEMTERYNKFAEVNVRDIKGYNAKIAALESVEGIDEEEKPEKLPQIVIIVDELADLMMVAPGEVEDAICRLAQLARAAGIHLIIATQRPSVNVITGLIKANMPSRIAFAVSSGVDSRTIIDMNGAEKLLGKGDMLFYPQGYQKPARVQGAFVSDEEVGAVVSFLKEENQSASYDKSMEEEIKKAARASAESGAAERDALFEQAGKFLIEKDKASIGMLQRMFKIGFNRAARIMDQLAQAGVVSEEEGTKPRKVLMSEEDFEKYVEEVI